MDGVGVARYNQDFVHWMDLFVMEVVVVVVVEVVVVNCAMTPLLPQYHPPVGDTDIVSHVGWPYSSMRWSHHHSDVVHASHLPYVSWWKVETTTMTANDVASIP